MVIMSEANTKVFNLFIRYLAVSFSLFLIAYLLGFFFIQAVELYCLVLIVFFVLEYLPDLAKEGLSPLKKAYGMFCMALGVIPHIYLFVEYNRLRFSYGVTYTSNDIFFGTLAIISVLIWVKRKYGWAMPIIAMVVIAYVLFGHFLPPALLGRGVPFSYNSFIIFCFSESAMYGSFMTIGIRVIFLYLLFGAFLNASGIGDYLIKASLLIAGKYRGGPAKVAVVSSALMGTITGSAVANVVTTGAITIPLMKKTGYQPHFAGAVEAVASTGGQILPPVMGAGAFIMAEFLGVTYAVVAIAATIPALLYYLAVFLQVDLVATKTGLRGAAPEDLPERSFVLKNIHMTIPIIALVYFLLIMKVTVSRAALITIALTIVISWTSKDFRMGPRKIFNALVEGTYDTVGLTAVLMVAGVITGGLTVSGFVTKFSSSVLTLAGGNLIITAALIAIICIILGMGLPTSAAYIITASMGLSSLLKLGITPMAANMFVFYYAILANITPPVAPATYAGAGLAGAPPIKTGIEAVKLAAIAYLMPFFFINNPNLLAQGTILETIQALITSVGSCALLAMVLQGITFKGNKLHMLTRVIWGVASLCMLDPGTSTDIIGIALFAAGYIIDRLVFSKMKKSTKA